MMPYMIILKVRKFHQPTGNRFSTTRQKPVGGTIGLKRKVHAVLRERDLKV